MFLKKFWLLFQISLLWYTNHNFTKHFVDEKNICTFTKKKYPFHPNKNLLFKIFVLFVGYTETKKLKLKTKFAVVDIFTFIHFSCPLYSKCIKKSSNSYLHQQKIFWFLVLVFWIQFIQQMEH